MEDIDFINEFKNMKSFNQICKQVGVDPQNLIKRKAKKDYDKKVALICKCEIIRLYNMIVVGDTNVNKTDTL